jgi:hypothetical protein
MHTLKLTASLQPQQKLTGQIEMLGYKPSAIIQGTYESGQTGNLRLSDVARTWNIGNNGTLTISENGSLTIGLPNNCQMTGIVRPLNESMPIAEVTMQTNFFCSIPLQQLTGILHAAVTPDKTTIWLAGLDPAKTTAVVYTGKQNKF